MTTPAVFGITAADYADRAAEKKTTATGLGATLGKEDFLSILVAQLKNQDPMSPMEGTEFATQLAQFSNVEQLINISSKMDAQSAATVQNQITSQTALGSSLIGRQISFESNELAVVKDHDTPVHFQLSGAATSVKIEILDSTGKVVFSDNRSNLAKGDQRFDLDTGDLKAGNYTYKVTATADNKSAVAVRQYGVGTVDGVSFLNGQIMLRIGSHVIPLLEISEILAVPAAAATSNANPSTESSTP